MLLLGVFEIPAKLNQPVRSAIHRPTSASVPAVPGLRREPSMYNTETRKPCDVPKRVTDSQGPPKP